MKRFSSVFLRLSCKLFASFFVFLLCTAFALFVGCASSSSSANKEKIDVQKNVDVKKDQNNTSANGASINQIDVNKNDATNGVGANDASVGANANATQQTNAAQNAITANVTSTANTKQKKSYAELVLQSYAQAYPQKNLEVLFLDDDWVIRQKDDVQNAFYWAEGRLLAKKNLANKNLYGAQQIYPYTGAPRNPALYTQEKIAELRKKGTKEALATEKQVDDSFVCFLLDAQTRAATERKITKTTFLGKRCNVHALIVPLLQKINDEILGASKNSREISDFLQSIYECGGYNWRTIDGTNGRRSNHSYGVAVDITIKNNNKTTYWEWERVWNSNWMTVPQSRLWTPPRAVIEIFEKYNFVWGGTWDEYDTMHFEWRPELFLLQTALVAQG